MCLGREGVSFPTSLAPSGTPYLGGEGAGALPVALSIQAPWCLADRGTVQKVIVLPRDDMETEELMLEEIEVFKVRAGSSCSCRCLSPAQPCPIPPPACSWHQVVPWAAQGGPAASSLCLLAPRPPQLPRAGLGCPQHQAGPLHVPCSCPHLGAGTHQDDDHLLQEGEWSTWLGTSTGCSTACCHHPMAAAFGDTCKWPQGEPASGGSRLSPLHRSQHWEAAANWCWSLLAGDKATRPGNILPCPLCPPNSNNFTCPRP